ncbi:MAG: hypothetical protein J5449_06080, partial [Oscillospiraceae bacterium]|nr:hypothetical protein [Oscillospiraceae bacterium]
MTENERDKEIREEIKRAKRAAPKKKSFSWRRALPFLLVLAAVLGIVGFAAKNLDSTDSLRRLFTYNKAKAGEDGKTELFSLDGDRTARYELLGKNLLSVS